MADEFFTLSLPPTIVLELDFSRKQGGKGGAIGKDEIVSFPFSFSADIPARRATNKRVR